MDSSAPNPQNDTDPMRLRANLHGAQGHVYAERGWFFEEGIPAMTETPAPYRSTLTLKTTMPAATPESAKPKNPHALQQALLWQCKGQRVRVWLMTGQELVGILAGFDTYSIALETEHKNYLLFKHGMVGIEMERQ